MNEIREVWKVFEEGLKATNIKPVTIAFARTCFFTGAIGALHAMFQLGNSKASMEVGKAALDDMVAGCNEDLKNG